MKYLDFEKHIKKELEGSKETVQMDALLASLNLGMEPKGKSKGFALWMILPFLILTVSALAWKFSDSYKKDFNEPYLTEEISVKKDNILTGNIIKEIIPEIKSTLISQNDVNTETITSSGNNDRYNAATFSSELNFSENITLKDTPNLLSNSPQAADIQANNQSQNINKNQLTEERNNSDLYSSDILSEETTTAQNTKLERSSIEDETSALTRNLLSITELNKFIHELEGNKADEQLFTRMKINCPSFNNARWHMALIPEVGVFLPSKTLVAKSSEQSLALEERLKSESTLEGIEFGLYGIVVRDNAPFYLKAGVSYSRISERMDLKYEYIESDTTIGIISSTVSANGDTITHIYGDIISETTFKGSNRQHHYIHLFDLPVSVGYSTYIAGLDIGIEGGVKVNFMTRATGNLLTSQKDYTNLSLNRMFKNRIGLSYFGGLMIGRNFGRFGDIYIAPRFTYYPNDFSNQNNGVSQEYFSIGLNVGAVYKIN